MLLYFFLVATVYDDKRKHINVYGDDVEVDYRGYDVSSICVWLSLNDLRAAQISSIQYKLNYSLPVTSIQMNQMILIV